MYRIGQGYDLHTTIEGSFITLGGIKIDAPFAFKAHSDGDVLIHAIIDALLGASGGPDIGTLYPDTDETFKDCDSMELLKDTYKRITNKGYKIVNLDSTLIAQVPKLAPYKKIIAENIASVLNLNRCDVVVKAKTNEGVDAIGKKQAIACNVVVLLQVVS